MGRPRKYFTEEERKQAIRPTKTKCMLNKEWRCPSCHNHNYTLAGKWTHLKTKKHKENHQAMFKNALIIHEPNSLSKHR